jgi:hypothetical protein
VGSLTSIPLLLLRPTVVLAANPLLMPADLVVLEVLWPRGLAVLAVKAVIPMPHTIQVVVEALVGMQVQAGAVAMAVAPPLQAVVVVVVVVVVPMELYILLEGVVE